MTEKSIYTFGTFRLDTLERVIENAGLPLSITPKALDVLIVLIENRGRIVEKEQLIKAVWPDTFVEDNSLAFNVSVLRKLFGESGASSQYIETVPRRGYRFTVEVAVVPRQELLAKPSNLTEREPAALAGSRQDRGGRPLSHRPAERWKMPAALVSVAVLSAALGWIAAAWSRSSAGTTAPRAVVAPPVIVLIDTSAPMGVYDPETKKHSGTNADEISDELRDLVVTIHKETVGSAWDREDQVLKQHPDLIIVHRSAFFHAMNLDFQLGYPPFNDSAATRPPNQGQQPSRLSLFIHLLHAAQDRLEVFLGYAGSSNPKTRFLIYSRGLPGEWGGEAFRHEWAQNLERRFPALKGRVFTLNVEGGENGRIRDPQTVVQLRRTVESILGLTAPGSKPVRRTFHPSPVAAPHAQAESPLSKSFRAVHFNHFRT